MRRSRRSALGTAGRGQQQIRSLPAAAVHGVRPGEAPGRPVARIVVQKPARAFLYAGFARALEVFSLQGERKAKSRDRKSTRLNSSHQIISYAVFCLKKKKKKNK